MAEVFLPKGTRDFLPAQMRNRQRVIDTLRMVFERFGFEPLETPAFERIETLLGKYGEEGDKLIYKILRRGEGEQRGEADLALRYDLTVPLARVVAMHPELRLPFRRYQMQPVWRADRPQKGRFREFWQCDVDLVGTSSPLADAECLAVVSASLGALGFASYTIRLNDRRILADLAALAGTKTPREETSVLIALDKIDKIGREGVERELVERGFPLDQQAAFWEVVSLSDTNSSVLAAFEKTLGPRAKEGVTALRRVVEASALLGVDPDRLRVDPTLARGLDYYTGPVFEAEVTEPKVGSISGGGRYDALIGIFLGNPVPAVGVSLGLERIIAVMEELGMLRGESAGAEVLVAVYGPETLGPTLEAARKLREAGISTEIFTEDAKLARQFKHANARDYPWLLLVGPDEAARGMVTLKELRTGQQTTLPFEKALHLLRPTPMA